MLLLALELFAIALCSGSTGSELGVIDTIAGLVIGKLYGAT